jgi:Trm5-related predicted tRNA methylase
MWGGAIRYCTDEGLIINSSGIHHLTPITRAELIGVWAKILQSKDMPKQNTVIGLPDVTADTPYYEDIVLFYEAGIIGGIDDKGTFHPDSDITRAEATTIFMNLIDLTKRHSGRTYGK